MEHAVKLSRRLQTVANYLPKGAFFADIGTDHAHLPCYVCMNDETARAIASEVAAGPFELAKNTVKRYQLSDVIDVRKGDGLEVIKGENIAQLVISGMGGKLIRSILQEGKTKLHSVQRIIVQPNIEAQFVRKILVQQGFYIAHEEMVEEKNHIYEIIVADKKQAGMPHTEYTEKELLFGPLLMEQKPAIFYKKWRSEYQRLQRVIQQMEQAVKPDQEKMRQLKIERAWVEEVLNHGS